MPKKFDFGGWATKNDLLCSDGRTIRRNAFQHQDGQTVPLVWQHMADSPENVLGHAVLQNKPEGVYAYCSLNGTDSGLAAKELIHHGDIVSLSIRANQLKQEGGSVIHGMIQELSLVIAGANKGAKIDHIVLEHSDGSETLLDDQAVIYPGDNTINMEVTMLEHADTPVAEKPEVKPEGEETLQDVFNTMNEKQKNVVYAMLAAILDSEDEDDEEVAHADDDEEDDDDSDDSDEEEDADEPKITHKQGGVPHMKKNVFDRTQDANELRHANVLTSAQFSEIVSTAKKSGGHLRTALLEHADTYGITNIEYLFPDARVLGDGTPSMVKRDTEWVAAVLAGTHHSPFSRVKTVHADITEDEARAKGYIKGTMKKDEVVSLLRRVTTPTTVYKRQKLDRDDILDATDLNVVAWLRQEMRLMLNEEVARAILVGDGRTAFDPDRINPENLRPIAFENELYMTSILVADDADAETVIEAIIRGRKHLKGSGTPTAYATPDFLVDMLLQRDTLGRRLYETEAALSSMLRVNKIVEVPVMAGVKNAAGTHELLAIVVNLMDYNIGTNKGGEITDMNAFDIDYNQEKYLIETRISGALTLPKAALTLWKAIPVESGT